MLSERELRFLEAYPERFVVSAVSIWEVRLKWHSLNRSGARKGPASASQVLQVLRTGAIAEFLPLTPEHASTELGTPLNHRDPFDELLLVQAQVEGFRLLTRDRKLTSHALSATAD
jgi:PIN domain nuclease of toxin-antitoxin system